MVLLPVEGVLRRARCSRTPSVTARRFWSVLRCAGTDDSPSAAPSPSQCGRSTPAAADVEGPLPSPGAIAGSWTPPLSRPPISSSAAASTAALGRSAIVSGSARPSSCMACRRWSDVGPADEEPASDAVERGLAVLRGDDRFGDVQREGDHAGEHQQPSSWTQLLRTGSVRGQVPDPEEQADHRQVHRRRDQWSHIGGYPEP